MIESSVIILLVVIIFEVRMIVVIMESFSIPPLGVLVGRRVVTRT